MALGTLNLAALPVKFVAIPVLAGLAAGTGAVAAYVHTPAPAVMASVVSTAPAATLAALPAISPPSSTPVATEQTEPVKSGTKPACEQQTWPYIDNRCVTRRGNEPANPVRVVMTPRDGVSKTASIPTLVTSDTVLRGPGVAPEVTQPPVVKKPAKRSEVRETRRTRSHDGFNRVYSVYSVPSAQGTQQPVIVVRPLHTVSSGL